MKYTEARRLELQELVEKNVQLLQATMFDPGLGFSALTANDDQLRQLEEILGQSEAAGVDVETGSGTQEEVDQRVEEQAGGGTGDGPISEEAAETRERERLESVREEYIAAGADGANLGIRDINGTLEIVYIDGSTGATHILDSEEVDLNNLGPALVQQGITGEFIELPPPPSDDSVPYFLDPDYRIAISPQDYFSMLRWLDPEVEERIEDRERVVSLFNPKTGVTTESDLTPADFRWRAGFTSKAQFNAATENRYKFNAGPKYAAGDEVKLFWGKSPEYVASIQQLLIEGNILKENEVTHMGEWGMAEESVIRNQMIAADERGLSIQQWLEHVAENPLPDGGNQTGFVTPVRQVPDYATLSQDVKATMRARLGREPEPYEMGDLVRQMESDHYADYQQQTEGARMEWEARQRAIETGETQSTGTIQNVDPFARFKETFDKKYQPEIDRNQEVDESRFNVGSLMSNLAGLEQAVQ